MGHNKRHQVAVAPLSSAPEPEPSGGDTAATRELRAELELLGLYTLQRRAAKGGIEEAGLEAALDAPAPT